MTEFKIVLDLTRPSLESQFSDSLFSSKVKVLIRTSVQDIDAPDYPVYEAASVDDFQGYIDQLKDLLSRISPVSMIYKTPDGFTRLIVAR